MYPLFFWSIPGVFVRKDYTQFNLGMVSIVSAMGVFALWFLEVDSFSKILAVVWVALILLVTGIFWQTGKIKEWVVCLPSFVGGYTFFQIYPQLLPGSFPAFAACLIGGGVLCGAIFNTVFGHWYLISSKFPIIHLKRSTLVFFGLLVLRFIWDFFFLWKGRFVYAGDSIPFYQFLFNLDGIFLCVAFLFGTLFPIGVMFLVWGTLKVNSTTSATGLLYIILIAVIIGDLIYKYYLYQYNIYL